MTYVAALLNPTVHMFVYSKTTTNSLGGHTAGSPPPSPPPLPRCSTAPGSTPAALTATAAAAATCTSASSAAASCAADSAFRCAVSPSGVLSGVTLSAACTASIMRSQNWGTSIDCTRQEACSRARAAVKWLPAEQESE